MKYPDKTTGDPSATDKEVYTVNALGETKSKTDRIGNVHTYSRDVVGRLTADAVTTVVAPSYYPIGSAAIGRVGCLTRGGEEKGTRTYLDKEP